MAAKLHLAENALALHLLLQRLEGLVDVIVTDENLHECSFVGSDLGKWGSKKALKRALSRLAINRNPAKSPLANRGIAAPCGAKPRLAGVENLIRLLAGPDGREYKRRFPESRNGKRP
jgi:hypothetical protein